MCLCLLNKNARWCAHKQVFSSSKIPLKENPFLLQEEINRCLNPVDVDAPSPWGIETKIEFWNGPFRVNFQPNGQDGNTIYRNTSHLECALGNITIHAFSVYIWMSSPKLWKWIRLQFTRCWWTGNWTCRALGKLTHCTTSKTTCPIEWWSQWWYWWYLIEARCLNRRVLWRIYLDAKIPTLRRNGWWMVMRGWMLSNLHAQNNLSPQEFCILKIRKFINITLGWHLQLLFEQRIHTDDSQI